MWKLGGNKQRHPLITSTLVTTAAWFATAYFSGEDTRLYRSWQPYLVVFPLSTTWGRSW